MKPKDELTGFGMMWRIFWTTTLGLVVFTAVLNEILLKPAGSKILNGIFGFALIAVWLVAMRFQWRAYKRHRRAAALAVIGDLQAMAAAMERQKSGNGDRGSGPPIEPA